MGIGIPGEGLYTSIRTTLMGGRTPVTEEATSVEQVGKARDRARQAGSNALTANIAQTILPRSTPENIGHG